MLSIVAGRGTSRFLYALPILAAALVIAAAKRSVPKLARNLYRVRKGRLGERLVTQLMTRLSDDYYLINDVVLAHGNVDHVLVGPCGILVLETKNVRGEIVCEGDNWTVNGRPVKSYSKQAKAAAMALRHRLAASHLRLQDEYIEAAVVLADPFCRVTVHDAHVVVVRFSEVLPLVAALSKKRQMQRARAEIIASVLASSTNPASGRPRSDRQSDVAVKGLKKGDQPID